MDKTATSALEKGNFESKCVKADNLHEELAKCWSPENKAPSKPEANLPAKPESKADACVQGSDGYITCGPIVGYSKPNYFKFEAHKIESHK